MLLAHDLTEVRRLALNTISSPHGEEGEVEEALKVIERHVMKGMECDEMTCDEIG